MCGYCYFQQSHHSSLFRHRNSNREKWWFIYLYGYSTEEFFCPTETFLTSRNCVSRFSSQRKWWLDYFSRRFVANIDIFVSRKLRLSHHQSFPGILSRIFAHRFELCAKLTSICKSNWDGSFMKQYPLFFILVAVKWQNHQRKKSENRRCHNHSTNSNQFHFCSRRFALLKWKWNSCGNHNENRSKAPNTQEGVVVVISIVNIDLYLNLDPFV